MTQTVATPRLSLLSVPAHGSAPGSLAEAAALSEETVVAYHERTKHHFHRFAPSLGYMDWATQPDPFRRYAGAPFVRLPLPSAGNPLAYWKLYVPGAVQTQPLTIDSLSLFFRYALSLTAWKSVRGSTWSLRANPSSGNLHPTEGYAILPALAEGDVEVLVEGVVMLLDPESATRADGMSIDFGDTERGSGFRIQNPNEPPKVEQLGAAELKAMLDRGTSFELIDVRTEEERAIARIAGSQLLDERTHDYLLGLDRSTTLVFQCHHGIRSESAAEYFLKHGFRNVYNLQGGIDAWSQLVDPSVPRY